MYRLTAKSVLARLCMISNAGIKANRAIENW
jgi:hypothetical protein